MPEFTANGFLRFGFGFCNPNHAAALICALAPFCWGWRGVRRWCGYAAFAALCVALALTYSRTGIAVLAMEMASWGAMNWRGGIFGRAKSRPSRNGRAGARPSRCCFAAATVALAAVAWWMRGRFAVDGAILNRPVIWLAGLRLFAANPLGVGFGRSGEIASAFLLPDGMAVRTLVNSHLTLAAETGAFAGFAWLVFVSLPLALGAKFRRAWIAFAGLALSAFSSSVFDWHVLFDFTEMGGLPLSNFLLSWATLILFVGTGVAMIARSTFAALRICVALAVSAVVLTAALCFRSDAAPRVGNGFVSTGGEARVYRGADWSLRDAVPFFPQGARFSLQTGVPDGASGGGDVWLFGDAAESAWRFPSASVTLVSPPEFCEAPSNVVRILQRRWGEEPIDDPRVEAY
jgi:hypothetical protein